jgi:glycosyltransferase involved in cell wall biosynthesis
LRPKTYLSIIIPAYNEAKRLPDTLEKITSFQERQKYSSEVLVVENGSQDNTLEIAREFSSRHPRIRVLQEKKAGKGLAVRRGMLEANGEYRFMCDADLSMPIEELNRFLPPSLDTPDIVIGSREAEGAVRYNEPSYRHIGGRIVNGMIRLMALPHLQDTQCGFKSFRAPVAEDLFRCQTIEGWSFDIELLYIARMRGYQVIELPIPWYYGSFSHVKPVKDTIRLAVDLIKIRSNAGLGLYDKKV